MEPIKIDIEVLTGLRSSEVQPSETFFAAREDWHNVPELAGAMQKRPTDLFVIRIIFTNVGHTPVAFSFDNRRWKAELLGLEITNASGERIIPDRGPILRFKPKAPTSNQLKPTERLVYDLVGERIGNWLKFPGASFNLSGPAPYWVKFQYQDKESQQVKLFD